MTSWALAAYNKRMARTIIALAALLLLPLGAAAHAGPRAIAVLDTERRWLAALTAHDESGVARILGDHFVHTNYRGALINREGAIAAIKHISPYAQHVGEETVDFAGNAAIVHGVNTVTRGEHIVMRLRFTDVFEHTNGVWLAVSAQETQIHG